MAGEARNGRDVRASVEPVRDSSDATAAERRHRELAFARPAAHLREPPRQWPAWTSTRSASWWPSRWPKPRVVEGRRGRDAEVSELPSDSTGGARSRTGDL